MSALEAFLVSRFMVFTLVLARTGALVMTAPIFGSQALPRQVRALLAVAMSLLVTPVYLSTSVPPVEHMLEYGRLLVNEALIGLLLGAGHQHSVCRYSSRRPGREPNERHVARRCV